MENIKSQENTKAKAMMLSVVVITYNHERYIEKAINSILMQRVDFDYEILIGDDASTDNTAEILKKFEEKYPQIHVTYREKNVGANYNAYDLLCQTKGKYFAFLDGDDYWTMDTKLQKQVDFLEEHPEYVGCTHRITIVDEHNKPHAKQTLSWVNFKARFTLQDFDGITLPGQASTLVRKNLFAYSDIDMSIIYKTNPQIGDRTSALIFLCNGDFHGIDEKMSAYRLINKKTGSNMTSQIYRMQESVIVKEITLTEQLEKIAHDMLGRELSFNGYKKSLVLSAIFQYIKRPGKERGRAVFYALKHTRHPVLTIMELPWLFIKKCMKR